MAKEFKNLGYEVGIFIDSDDENTNIESDKLVDIKVFRYSKGYNTEKRILKDIKSDNYSKIIDILNMIRGKEYVDNQLMAFFDTSERVEILKLENEKIIDGLYNIMTKKDAFKGTKYGELLGELIISLDDFKSSELTILIENIRKWCHHEI